MSSQELQLIDEFLNFKDFSNVKKGSKNQELGPWGTPQGDQDLFCYRKRLEETSALTNKATKKQLKTELQSPFKQQYNEDVSSPQDTSQLNLSFHNIGDGCDSVASNLLAKSRKIQHGLTYQMSQTSQRSDFLGNQENKLYQSAEMDTSYYLKKGIDSIKSKNQSVGRSNVIQANHSLLPNSEQISIRYDRDLHKIKQVLREQNESQKVIYGQGNTHDSSMLNQFECYSSTLALMQEGNNRHQTSTSLANPSHLTQQNVSRSKRSIYEQRRILGHYISYADPKQRINQIREQLNQFQEGKKKFEKVLKISRLSSMTPEQPMIQRNEQNLREIRQKISKTNKIIIDKKKKFNIYDVPADKLQCMIYGTRSRIDCNLSTNSVVDARQNSFNEIQQITTNNSFLVTQQQQQTQMRNEMNKLEINKLPRLSNNNSNIRGVKSKVQYKSKAENLQEYFQSHASPSTNTNKIDLSKAFKSKKIIQRGSDIS